MVPDIEVTDIQTSLMSLTGHPAYLPGYGLADDHRPGTFKTRTEPAVDHNLSLPETVTINGSRTFTQVLFRLDEGEQETFKLNKTLYGLSIVQAVTHGPGIALNKAHNQSQGQRGITVGEVRITFEDDDTAIFPLVLGLNTNRLDARLRGSMLFGCRRSRDCIQRHRIHRCHRC